MPELISKVTAMFTEVSSGLLTIVGVAAALAIVGWSLYAFFTDRSKGWLEVAKSIGAVLVFAIVAFCATGLVEWAVSM